MDHTLSRMVILYRKKNKTINNGSSIIFRNEKGKYVLCYELTVHEVTDTDYVPNSFVMSFFRLDLL